MIYSEASFALSDDVILYDQTKNKLNPFEMYSFSLGFGRSNSHKRSSNDNNKMCDYYEFKLEGPIYKEYVGLGFEYSFINKNIMSNFNILGIIISSQKNI